MPAVPDSNVAGQRARPPPIQAVTFEIDADIDINSKALRDMVSVDPVVREEFQPQHSQQPSATAPHTQVAPDWNW